MVAVPIFSLLAALVFAPAATAATVVINEFQASNSATIADEDGDYPDWLELYNHGGEPVFLAGFGLSDDASNPFRWVFPDVVLEPGQFLLVFASNKDRTAGPHLHTNFAISADGEELLLTAPDGEAVDFIEAIAVPTDRSLGRQPDGVGDWYFFDAPTPGTANTGTAYEGILEPPALSHEPGFHEAPFVLAASHPDPAAAVHYTLDGALPGPDDPVLAAPLLIPDRSLEPDVLALIPTADELWWIPPIGPGFKGTPVRVRAYREGWLPSPVVTRTYFVSEQGADRYDLPAVSLVTDPAHFLDGAYGIYVPGDSFDGVNLNTMNAFQSGRDWERPVHFELFEDGGGLGIAQELGARIHGGGTRMYPQKSLRLYARNEYAGTNAVEYPLIPGVFHADGSELTTFRRFLLRNSGNDFTDGGTMFRDLLMQRLVLDMERMETQGGRPAAVFLNGEFWGLFNIRERYDPHYFAVKYGIEPGRVTILERDAWLSSGPASASHDYLALRQYAVDHDLSDPAHYEYVIAKLDPQSKIDHWVANIYFHNTDWPQNNIQFWRYERNGEEPGGPGEWWRDGRWRWMLYDTDLGFNLRGPYRVDWNNNFLRAFEREYGSLIGPAANTLKWTTHELNGYLVLPWPNELFRSMLDNEGFRHRFINRMADRLNTSFREEHVTAAIAAARAQVEGVMPEHLNRWRQNLSNIGWWLIYVDQMRAFGQQRPGFVRQHVIEEFELEGTYELTIAMPPEGSARVRINAIELEADGGEWTGIYFQGVPIEVEVLPEFGFEFLGWQGAFEGEGTLLNLDSGSDISLEPIVKEDAVTLHELILPRFMQGTAPGNNDRVPYSCRLRIEGLLPNAPYRFANRVVTADDPPTQNGAGNAIYYAFDTASHFRTTATPDFSEPGTYGAFVTDDNGVYEGWFTLEPSGNARFGEPEVFIRILLNDGEGGEEYRHFLTTQSAVQVLSFGFGWEEATGLYASSPLTPGEVVVLYDDIDGEGRPVTATLVEGAGFEVDERYAAFYQQFVSGLDGHFGTLLPNLLPNGLTRIEAFDWHTAESAAVYTRPDGLWPPNADTINPDGGLGFPLALVLGEPDGAAIPGDVNGDGVVNAIDVQLVINAALGIELDPAYNADINNDGVVNAIDVQLVINAALGEAIAP